MSLGCIACRELAACGGLHIERGVYNCLDYCCGKQSGCELVCQRNPSFPLRSREVNGFELGDIPRAEKRRMETLPTVVPVIRHGGHRRGSFGPQVAAISLYDVIDWMAGRPKFSTVRAIQTKYRLSPSTKIVLTGTHKDAALERWWSLGVKRKDIVRELAEMGIVGATTPNFSLFHNRPRWDDLHSIKRIAIVWQEMVDAGLPTALHVNARSDRDWERWRAFVRERSEVCEIAYEFATGGRHRLQWHAEHLRTLARDAGRQLSLIIRGGKNTLQQLSRSYEHVTLLDSVCFMRTVHRQAASHEADGRLRWHGAKVGSAALDRLLEHNWLEVVHEVQCRCA